MTKIIIIISLTFLFFIIVWLWLHCGKRGIWVAMTATYYALERGLRRNNSNIDQKIILVKTLQSRMTYRNLSRDELEEIVSRYPTINSLITFVIRDEEHRSFKKGR